MLFGGKPALRCQGTRQSYASTRERALRLAGFFRDLGLKFQDKVAILHPNCHYFLESYFAAAASGLVLVPLNFRLSPRELAFILRDSESRALIAHSRFLEAVTSLKEEEGIEIPLIWTHTQGRPELPAGYDYETLLKDAPLADPLPLSGEGHEAAQIYYTSGTTGRPKGVVLTHKNVQFHALGTIAELKLTDEDIWIHAAPMFHLADAWATFALTWVGGGHVFVPDFEPTLILNTLVEEKVTLSNMIPTMLNLLVNHPDIKTYRFPHLRVLLSGGAPIAPETVRKIIEAFGCDYIQTYGMTETSPYLTLSILKGHLKSLPREERLVVQSKTGRPFIGVSLKVVRENGEEVRPDDQEVGEIIVRGDIVTPGYWNLPEETQKAFRDGWLYTGDLAVVDEEGYVNIVDRKKDMILTGGENVYSTEVEYTLYRHPAILEAAVIGVPDEKWGEAVKAFVVLKDGAGTGGEEIIAFCKEEMASYKAPKTVEFLPALPRTGSGKIYKQSLRDPYWKGLNKKVH